MSSDVQDIVVAIQGNPVKREILDSEEDGYILTWSASNNNWSAQPATSGDEYFTSSGIWICPPNVTRALLIGCGGGGGGAGACNPSGTNTGSNGSGGGGALQNSVWVTVVPGVSYLITIANGGAGGNLTDGYFGGDTTFGSLALFSGASGGSNRDSAIGLGGGCCCKSSMGNAVSILPGIANGGWGANNNPVGMNVIGGFAPGITPIFGDTEPGSGGGAGPQGAGGNGGESAIGTGDGGNGTNCANNSGAGGGGGGGSTGGTPGKGGDGGSGYLYVIWRI